MFLIKSKFVAHIDELKAQIKKLISERCDLEEHCHAKGLFYNKPKDNELKTFEYDFLSDVSNLNADIRYPENFTFDSIL